MLDCSRDTDAGAAWDERSPDARSPGWNTARRNVQSTKPSPHPFSMISVLGFGSRQATGEPGSYSNRSPIQEVSNPATAWQ